MHTMTLSKNVLGLAVCLLALTSASPASAAVVTFQQGAAIPGLEITNYTGTADNTLIAGSSTANLNYGGATTFYIGKDKSGNERNSILRFDVSSLSGQFTSIQSVTLTLTFVAESNFNAANIGVNLYQISDANAGWNPGTGTGNNQSGVSTWNNQSRSTVNWAGSAGLETAGTDYVATVLDGTKTVSSGTTGSGATYTWTLPVELLSYWLDDTNAGLLLTASNFSGLADGDFLKFASSEHGTASYRPSLAVNYTAVPEPGSVALLGLAGAVLTIAAVRRRKLLAQK